MLLRCRLWRVQTQMTITACWIPEPMSWLFLGRKIWRATPTMCALVGNNQAEGLIVARLNTQNRTHLIAAVQDAKPLLPISYLIRIAKYRAIWRMVGEKDCFCMKDGYGNPVNVAEDEDLLYLSKSTFWRVGHDLHHSAIRTTGMSWKEIWKTLTGEEVSNDWNQLYPRKRPIDFVELFNPGTFFCPQGWVWSPELSWIWRWTLKWILRWMKDENRLNQD